MQTASDCVEHPGAGAVQTLIAPRRRELSDGFFVRRALPSSHRRLVGPFIFFDHMGPAAFEPGGGLDVRPHPHIGLSTLTYLFEGEILHRDSLGVVQSIRPGEANWMTAGRGIVHSERTPADLREAGGNLHGIQCWLALPRAHEEVEPSFVHHAADELPVVEGEGLFARIIGGAAFGARAAATTYSPLFYADVVFDAGARLAVPDDHEERAVYVVTGEIAIGESRFGAGNLMVLVPGVEATITAKGAARVMLLGGEPMDGERHIWWNFVHSSRERIETAGDDWRSGRFPSVPGDPESIPLPGDPEPVVRYP